MFDFIPHFIPFDGYNMPNYAYYMPDIEVIKTAESAENTENFKDD